VRDNQRKFLVLIPIFTAIIGVALFTALTAPDNSHLAPTIDTQRQSTPLPQP